MRSARRHPRFAEAGIALVALGLGASTQGGCEAWHRIGSAGFVRSRGVEPQLGRWTVARLGLGDLDGDGVADLAALDPTTAELCLRRADPTVEQPLSCQILESSDEPRWLGLAQLSPLGRAQVVTAGRSLTIYAPWTIGQPLALGSRVSLPGPSPALAQSRGWQAGGEAPIDTLWTVSPSPPRVTAWTFTRPEQASGVAPPSAIAFPLTVQATALLPRLRADGLRELWVATEAGVEWWRSTGTQQSLPCGQALVGSVSLALLDLDGDDDEDVLGLLPDGSLAAIERLSGGAGWGCAATVPLQQPGRTLLGMWAADFDGDGRTDLLAASSERADGMLLWRRGQPLLRFPLSALPRAVAVADADGDHRPDVAILLSDGSFELWHNSFVPG